MLNKTEYNNVVICVLPMNVEMPTPKNYDAYCKKYAPKRTRKLTNHVSHIKALQLDWHADGCEISANGRNEYLIESCCKGYCLLVITDNDNGFNVVHIPSVHDAIAWAEKYEISSVNYATYNIPDIEWEDVSVLVDVEKLCANY